MAFITASIDSFALITVLTVLPWLYFTTTPRAQLENNLQRRRLLSVFIALHSIYILYKLIVLAPQNVFSLLHVPLSEPSDNIRQLLMRKARVSALPKTLEDMLMRLQSFDTRTVYSRFGHSVVQECDHCTTFDDFALYALPRALIEYVRMAAVIGIVTMRGSNRERWRFWGLGSLVAASAAELYFVMTTEVTFPKDGKQTIMLHDTALRLRRVFFLLLPPLLYLIPPRLLPPSPLEALPGIVARAERTRARLQLLRLTTAARARHPGLRAPADTFWASQRTEGQRALNDPALREMAAKLGIEIDIAGAENETTAGDSGGLRKQAKTIVELLQTGFRPRD